MPVAPLNVGELLAGKYQIDGQLGEGGFATVFSATDVTTGQSVAIKVLKPEADGYSTQTRARFRREVDALAGLQSPYIVRVLDDGETDAGQLYAVFEHVPGRDLSKVLGEIGRVEPEVAEHILQQLLHALREAHRAGVLHRDIKPENIRVFTEEGDPWRVKLLDFGIARPLDDGSPSLTKTGELIGTPRYMSPEQLLDKTLTPASDVYSLGMVVFELIAGRGALPGGAWGDQLERLRSGFQFAPDLPQDSNGRLMAVVRGMTALKVEMRLKSVDAVLAALESPAPQASPPPRAQAPPRDILPVRGTSADSTSNLMLVAVMLGLLVIVAGAAAAFVYLKSNENKPVRTVPRTPAPSAPRPPTPQPLEPPAITPSPDAGHDMEPDAADPPRRSTGCGKRPPRPEEDKSRVRLGGHEMFVALPRGYDRDQTHATILVVHGTWIRSVRLARGGGFEDLANEHGVVVIAPQGGKLAPPSTEDVLEAWRLGQEELCLDPTQLLVFGHGSGGGVAADVACRTPHATLATSAFRKDATRCHKPLPHLHFAQDEDGYNPFEGGPNCGVGQREPLNARIDAWKQSNECGTNSNPKPWFEHRRGACETWECASALVVCKVEGGRYWEGMEPDRTLDSCDGSFSKFPFTDAIWKFMQENALASSGTGGDRDR